MASEPFEATDDNGITVTGTVDVYRHPKGPYYDPNSKYYKQSRYADAHFDYFNTRGACTIDRNVLSKAMEDAFANALTRFGITTPDRGRIADDVNKSISATRQQCLQNADKYVSNETTSSTNWETGKAVGNLIAKAYAAVPAPGGGMQTVVAREDSWAAADVTNASIQGRRVFAGSIDDNRVGSGSGSPAGIYRINATHPATALHAGGAPGISSDEPVRYQLRRVASQPPAFVADAGAQPMPDLQDSFDGRFGNWTAPAAAAWPSRLPLPGPTSPNPPGQESALGDRSGIAAGVPGPDNYPRLRRVSSAFPDVAPRNPEQPVPQAQRAPALGLFGGNPMSSWSTPVQLGGLLNNSSGPGDNDLVDFPAGLALRNPTQPEPPQTAGAKPERWLGRSVITSSPAPGYDRGAAAAPLVPSADAN